MACRKVRTPDGKIAMVCGSPAPRKKAWPKTGEEVKAAGYRSTGRGQCRACPAMMVWVETPKGEQMPLVKNEQGLWIPHFANCPGRKRFIKA